MAHGGTSFEWTVGRKFQKMGYRVQRAYESVGIWDLLCLRKVYVMGKAYTEVLEVQVKGTPYEFTEQDKLDLKKHAEEIGARAVYAYGKRLLSKTKLGKNNQPILNKHRTIFIEYLHNEQV